MIQIRLEEEEFYIVCELVFAGNWLINSDRIANTVEKYEEAARKVESLHRSILFPQKKITYNDMHDHYMDRLKGYIHDFASSGLYPTLAKRLAEVNYPVSGESAGYCGSRQKQCDAQAIYESELRERGIGIISIDIPNLDGRLVE